ncbi:MAG: pirin family protein [Sphingobacterium sp.]
MAKFIYHPSDSRGFADHGWLQSRHTFSFADYLNAERMNFGALRVLNNDQIAPGRGFAEHPHRNMEIISIPLEGELAHSDSMGFGSVIKKGEIQVMSAGRGVEHREYNHSRSKPVNFLQIWVIPNRRDVEPRYDHRPLDLDLAQNRFLPIVSPAGGGQNAWIYQDAWFHLANFESGFERQYVWKKSTNGLYLFVLLGEIDVQGQRLQQGDGLGIGGASSIKIKATRQSEILLMEVPLLA